MPAGAKPNHALCGRENSGILQKHPAPGGVDFMIPAIFSRQLEFFRIISTGATQMCGYPAPSIETNKPKSKYL
jgi:hypothetical protein